MAEQDREAVDVDQPEPDDVIPERPLTTPDHPSEDADDREVELVEPDTPDPPVDQADAGKGDQPSR
jgi:hypothetical protein